MNIYKGNIVTVILLFKNINTMTIQWIIIVQLMTCYFTN